MQTTDMKANEVHAHENDRSTKWTKCDLCSVHTLACSPCFLDRQGCRGRRRAQMISFLCFGFADSRKELLHLEPMLL